MVDVDNSILKNDVWEIVSTQVGQFVIYSRWMFEVKLVVDKKVQRFSS